MPLGIGLQQVAGCRHRRLVADRGHHIVQRAALRGMIKHLVGGEERQAVCLRERIKPGNPGEVIAGIEIAGGQIAQARQPGDQVREELGKRGGEQAPPPLQRRGSGGGECHVRCASAACGIATTPLPLL